MTSDEIESARKKALDYRKKADFSKALKVYDTILNSDPTNKDVLIDKSQCYRIYGDYAAAIQTLTAIPSYEDNPIVLMKIARCHVEMWDFNAAIEQYQFVINLKGISCQLTSDAVWGLAECYEEMGSYDHAIVCFEHALRKFGNNALYQEACQSAINRCLQFKTNNIVAPKNDTLECLFNQLSLAIQITATLFIDPTHSDALRHAERKMRHLCTTASEHDLYRIYTQSMYKWLSYPPFSNLLTLYGVNTSQLKSDLITIYNLLDQKEYTEYVAALAKHWHAHENYYINTMRQINAIISNHSILPYLTLLINLLKGFEQLLPQEALPLSDEASTRSPITDDLTSEETSVESATPIELTQTPSDEKLDVQVPAAFDQRIIGTESFFSLRIKNTFVDVYLPNDKEQKRTRSCSPNFGRRHP